MFIQNCNLRKGLGMARLMEADNGAGTGGGSEDKESSNTDEDEEGEEEEKQEKKDLHSSRR